MAFSLKEIVPWGRSFSEYVSMFALSKDDLRKRILGCGDGPAGFNCELTRRGGSVVSVDPLYECEAEEIRARIHETFEQIMDQTRKNKHEFVWKHIRSVEELGHVRMSAMEEFLADYEAGREQGRYVAGSLPSLEFPNDAFDLAVCSHFLFLYSEKLSLDFHIVSIAELCRVSPEVRVSPLLQLGARPSPHIASVTQHFTKEGLKVEIIRVPYEFQRGGNKMLRVKRDA